MLLYVGTMISWYVMTQETLTDCNISNLNTNMSAIAAALSSK